MWKNKEVEVPAYVPPATPPKADNTSGIRVIKPTGVRPQPATEAFTKDEVPNWGSRGASPAPSAPPGSLGSHPMSDHAGSVLGAGLDVKGEISGSDDLLINGSVDGLIQLEGHKVTIGPTAKIVADVLAAEIIVYGNIKGNLCARDRIEVRKDGSVVGDLTTSRITIEDGAYFKGTIEIDRKVAAAAADPVVQAPRKEPAPERVLNLNGGTGSLHMP